ncbi:lipoprotein [Spiroplasma taiwanense]|uniref:Lipoprotein n=1 Tax=Spiroplasma taiwanense CT-1 TaxID=1276220 RepID=S5MH74_9MOLU|nr:lipoprotein [Spiroplasma taiwanense]AGR41175.1 hypothetical protein STAIW_v1c05500 [Spiroplasma taiwanense CT-1]
MKKLLSLLASTSMVTTATVSVVACGNKEGSDTKPPVQPEQDLTALIADFKKDITAIKDEYWNEINKSFFSLVDVNQQIYQLLTKEKITQLVTENGNNAVTSLNENDQNLLKIDIQKIIKVEDLKQKFISKINKEKYSILINELNWFTGFSIDWSTLEINFTGDEIPEQANPSSKSDSFLSYVKVDLKFEFKYLDKNGQETTFNINQKFIFTLTSNKVLIESIQALKTTIKTDYLLDGQKYSFIDKSELGISLNQGSGKIFGNDLNFKSVYESNGFKNDIISFMKNNYFDKFINISLSFEGKFKGRSIEKLKYKWN